MSAEKKGRNAKAYEHRRSSATLTTTSALRPVLLSSIPGQALDFAKIQ
ncbi:MAG: hypothetical protein WC082_11000 [Victivallales bacterium]